VAKKSKENISENNLNDDSQFDFFNIFSKIFGPLKALIKIHLKIASKELKKDFARYASGLISLFFCIFFMVSLLFFINILIVLLLKDFFEFSLFHSILILSGLTVFGALLTFIIATSAFKKPFLKETKKAVKETLKDLK
jgi:hypothetical protein